MQKHLKSRFRLITNETNKVNVTVKKAVEVKSEQPENACDPQVEITLEKELKAGKDTPAASPTLASEIERLRLNWKQILEDLPPNLKKTNAAAAPAAVRRSKPVSIENETVVISLKYAIHKDNMEKPEYLQVVEKIISDYLGPHL